MGTSSLVLPLLF